MTDATPPPRPIPLAQAQRPRRFKTARTVSALVMREMATSYGRSPGGYVWAILEPVGGIVMLTLVFSMIMRSPALGSNFPLFYATGYLPFMLYNDLGTKILAALRFSKPLLAYPGVTWLDAVLGRFALNLLTHLMVFCLIMTGIETLYDTGSMPEPGPILNALAMAAALGLGIGTLNCFLASMFPVWQNVWGILTRPMFIISGIFFLYDELPGRVRDILWWNPLIHVTSEMRRGFYGTYDPVFVSPIYVYGVAGACFVLGLVFLNRYHRDILNER